MPTNQLKKLIMDTSRDNQLPAEERAKELMDEGANANECLLIAASYHRIEFIRWLIVYGKADVNFTGEYNRTPLIKATSEAWHYQYDPGCIRLLLDHGANPDLYTEDGQSPLLVTDNLELIKLLLEYRADPDHQDSEKMTCLMKNVGNPLIVECLLQHGAKPDLQNSEGQTALMLAIEIEQLDTISLLLTHNSSIDICDKDNQTAPHYALRRCRGNIFTMLCNYAPGIEGRYEMEMLPLLYHERFNKPLPKDINEIKNHRSPLIKAVEADDCPLVEKLIRAGADVNLRTNCRTAAIDYVKSAEILRLLFQHNAQITIPSASSSSVNYRNPIITIIGRKNRSLLEEYLKNDQAKAIINKSSYSMHTSGSTPLATALELASTYPDNQDYVEFVRLLLEAGADPLQKTDGRSIFLTPCSPELKELMTQALESRLNKTIEDHNLDKFRMMLVNTDYLEKSFILLDTYKDSLIPYDGTSQNQQAYQVWMNSQIFIYQAFYCIHEHAVSKGWACNLIIYNEYQSKACHFFRSHIIQSLSNLIPVPLTDEWVLASGIILKMIQNRQITVIPEARIREQKLSAEREQLLLHIIKTLNQSLNELSQLKITGYQTQDAWNIVKEYIEHILPEPEHDSPGMSMS
ncbi:Ankyrin repeats (3 copies) [Legionella moravica]|uniref:Ankyrin repeats (3 copies) n=1 Tax=Legionella moravica TaxID=39962 RepID=A0A378JVV9_9GAMM|nr:ankyrin repeat domain-containing protein [Legionella moravica]KTD35575.1 Ankyrin repeats (3 copies) [Legionella moravica]STX62724.1 Uroporphyrinogen-III decarboxylase [Legionella moravica]